MIHVHAIGRAEGKPAIQGDVHATMQAAFQDVLRMIEHDGCRKLRVAIDIDINSPESDRVMSSLRRLATLDL